MKELLRVNDLSVSFNVKGNPIKAVDGINLTMDEGEIVVMLGETGCGKSVFGNAILKILPDNASVKGQVYYKGKEIISMNENEFKGYRGAEICAIPQSPSTSLNPLMRCGKQVQEALLLHKDLQKEESKSIVINLLKKLGLPRLPSLYKDYPFELSGGMKQRILVALGIICEPNFIIVDEPTKGLDWIRKMEVINLLAKLAKEHQCAMLVITHDFSVAEVLADKIALMYAGEIIEYGDKNQILNHPKHPYTKGLIASMPSKGLNGIKGFSPPLDQIPNGCRFHTRCENMEKACNSSHPELFTGKNNHMVRCLQC